MKKTSEVKHISGFAVCRNTPDCVVEDVYLTLDEAKAMRNAQWYRDMGEVVWIETRDILISNEIA